jgi:hypothetical protein
MCFRIVVILTLLLLSLLVVILTALVGKGIYDAVKSRKSGKIRRSRLNNDDNDFDDVERSGHISMNNIASAAAATGPKHGED